jgi:hypothetical protein
MRSDAVVKGDGEIWSDLVQLQADVEEYRQ